MPVPEPVPQGVPEGVPGAPFPSGSEGGLPVDERALPERAKTRALFATWAIMGLWHGANWTFVIWGLWHAALVWLYRRSGPLRAAVPEPIRGPAGWAVTMAAVMLGWIWFRVPTVGGGVAMLARAFDPTQLGTMALRETHYLMVFLYLIGLLGVAAAHRLAASPRLPRAIHFATLTFSNAAMLFWVFLLLRPVKQFIYFQF